MLNPLEKTCVEAHRRRVDPTFARTTDESADWIRFGLTLLLETGRMVRNARTKPGQIDVEFKDDGSPATLLEMEIESLLKDRLTTFEPSAVVVGEETGGTLVSSGFSVAMDPVDGTWAFLSGTETYATTLAVFRDGTAIVGMVSNPVTAAIGYATKGAGTRLLQLSAFGEPDSACTLPEERGGSADILVNVHPNRRAGPLVGAFNEAWKQGDVNMVRSPGGSPAWALLEAARGKFTYVNLWPERPAEAYDLAAGVLLVWEAGGDVTDLQGNRIDSLRHAGPFIAGVDDEARQKVAHIALEAIRT